MRVLDNQELLTIQGGAISQGLIIGIFGIAILIIGIIDGYLRPNSCKK